VGRSEEKRVLQSSDHDVVGVRPVSSRSCPAAAIIAALAGVLLLTGRAGAAPANGRPAATRAASDSPRMLAHTFMFIAAGPLKSVSVAGSFNGWNKDANPLQADPVGRTWRTTLTLPAGKHQYKFVENGDTWIPDPRGRSESDGNGNTNSVLLLLPSDYAQPARPDDGVIARSALFHEGRLPYVNYDRGALTLSLRARPGDLQAVTLLANGKRYAMHPLTGDELYVRYSASVPWDRKTDLSYVFELKDGPRTARFGANGLAPTTAPFALSAKEFRPFVVPNWVEKSVIYQIFPDRFADGDKRNDPSDVVAWDAVPTYSNRFGGDAAGVKQHLDYLANLGISAVYFNPVFASPSNHRYDTTDYKRIDPQFGTNAEFADLTRAMDRRGIRTVMDFAFNHTATNFAEFADIRKNGAASRYKDWYFVHSYPIQFDPKPNYEAWWGFSSMPKLNVLNPDTRNYLLGVADFWEQEIPLGGMRLDAANEVDMRFWRTLRTRIKAAHPETWILGEVWGDGSPWLGGDQWDSVMDYPFREACIGFIADGKTRPTDFTNRLMSVYSGYAPQVSRNLMNLLSSHDTPRFLTLCKDDERLARLAADIQFTWAGTPSIYYGEELGMQGGADPADRGGMRWDLATAANPMLAHYRSLIAARNRYAALQSGDPQILMTDDAADTLAYARILGPSAAVVVINRSNEPRSVVVPLPADLRQRKGELTDVLSARKLTVEAGQTQLTVAVAPLSAMILAR
jgi:cyclomaltodextrinase